ncbi:DEAD/DEAH box helicase family protein [Campylobacter upsaliensis]|nr:DEAD/DEAH box helicase family protein [Campylobacter upsaliensis]
MQFNFNFEAFEQSGKEKNEAINYLKSLNSSIDFDKLEQENKGDENAIYEALKGGNFSFSKPSIEQTRQKLLKNKENEALKAEFNAGLSWLGEEKKQNFNFYDFKKAKEKANSKQGLIQADLKAKEKELKRKEALFETRLKERGIIAKSFDDMLDQSGAYLGADLLEKGLNKLGFKDENYIFESEKEDIKSRALKSVREKLERGDLEFNEREKHALRSKYDEPDYKKALEKEKERLRLSQKSGNFSEAEREFIENDLGFFNTLFNDDKENIKEFKEKVKSEGVISSEIIKAANTLKAFDEGNLFKNMLFADEKEKKEFQQNFLNDAYKIAELSGFDDVGLDKKGELYFIKDEQKYLVNTGFFDNFAQLLNDTKFEFAGGVLGGMKGFNSGKSAKGKVAKSILGAAAGSFGGAFLDAKIADMYLNRESDFKKNLDFAIQAGLLSMAGDGVILSVKPLAKGLYKGVKKGGEILGEYSILGTLKTLPQQNIQAAEKIIDEVFSPKMKEELKAAQEEFGGSVRGEDLKNAFFANLQKKFTQKYGENDSKTKSVAKIAAIFNTNSLKTRQQAMLDLVRSDTHGSTLAYLLEIAKDDVKIQSNLKNMLNLASSNVEKNLKNLNINAREIKHILDEFEAGNKAAFKEVESQIARLYDENYRVVLSKGEYENIKEEFRQNGVNLEEMTPFLRDLEANVFNENGVSFTQLNNFRKNLNFYIFNKDKTPNFINTLKKIGENILKNEIDKGIDNIFSQNKAAYESIKELYSTSLKDYATLKSLNESIKNLKLQDSAKSADEVLNSLIKYAKGQGEKGVNNLQKIKDYLGEENNAFLEMQILNKLFKESVVENDRASLRVFDSESFLGRVRELVGDTPAPLGANLEARALSGASQGPSKQENFIKKALNKDEAKLFLENLNGAKIPKKLDIEGFLKELESVENKENFISHLSKKEDAQSRLAYLNLVEPTLKEADLILHNGKRQDYIKKFNDGKDFFTLLITEENGKRLITFLPKTREDFIKNKIDNASLIQSFTSRASKQGNGLANESITQPLFKSKEAREFLELVEGFHKLYKNDASIAKNLVQGTSEKLSTSIATSAEGAIKQKVVKGGFDPIFRLLPDGILFGLFSKQIQGGALRYHLKKALSRSLNYDDFKIKLEKELKRTNFNSNTSRLIDEFMQNLEDFNREKEQFLKAKRAEEARIKEEEQARINAIKTAQENAYHTQEANLGQDILETELKEDFGENFAGYKGKEAIEKLLEEQRGQVKGAFYKEGLGEIDLVWGDKNYGLEHILNKHGGEFKNLARELSEAVENGKIVKDDKGRLRLEYENKIVGIKDNWKGEKTAHWVVTAYVKKEKEASLYTSASFTKGEALPLNSKESIAQKALNLHEKLYLKDNDTPLNVEYKIVNKDDIKPSFTLSKTQFRSQKQEDLIKKIKENFNPDLLVNIRGDLKKGNPIITKEGEVISGNHRAAALKELEGENLAKYQNAVKEAFGVELKENEMLVRVADTSEAEIRRFSAASNEGLENNLGEQGVSLFAKYQDKIKALKEAKKPFVADDVYNLKYLVNKALGESSITKENDTSKALFASLARGRNNTILKALNELEKENLEQVSKVANMFFDNAGAFYNLTHDLDLPKMQNLQNYFSDVLVSAAKADFTRAEDFARLNEDIRAFLDSGDKNAMLKLSPNLVSDLLAKAMGAGFARFARLENPSASLYEFLNGLKKDLLEKGMPDLFSGGKGIKLNERDEFDFAKELILKGQDSEEKFRLYQNLEELKAWKSKSSLNQPTKESLDKDLNKSYTLELENLEPVSLNANALSKETEALTQSVESGHKQSTTIAKTDEQSIAENGIKDDKQAFLQFIKIMQDTKNGDFYPSENLQNALEKSGKKARENALELFTKEYESKDAKLVELLKNIQEARIASKALSLIKHFTQARMMQSAIKAVPSDILMKYVNIDASQRLEVLSSLYGDFSNIMKEVALKGKKIPDPAALSEKGGAYVFNRQYRKILNIYEKIQENEELLRLLAHKNDYKTTIEIIQESKAKGLSVKQTKEAIEENKKQTAKLFDEVIRQENKPSVKPLDEFGINFEGFKGKEAINKLLEEQRGQVAGAFYKEGLGEIDLVWGDSKKGLSHILERRKEDFIKQGLDENEALERALEFVKKIPQIIEQGEVKVGVNRAFVDTKDDRALIALDYKGKDKKWVITAYKMDDPSQADTHLTRLNTSTSSVSRASVVNESIAQNEHNAVAWDEFEAFKDKDDILKANLKGEQNSAKENEAKRQADEYESLNAIQQERGGGLFTNEELNRGQSRHARGNERDGVGVSKVDGSKSQTLFSEGDFENSRTRSGGNGGRGYTAGEENALSIRGNNSSSGEVLNADENYIRENNPRYNDTKRPREDNIIEPKRSLHMGANKTNGGANDRSILLKPQWSEALEKQGLFTSFAKAHKRSEKFTFTDTSDANKILEDNFQALEGLKYVIKSGFDNNVRSQNLQSLQNFRGFGKGTNALLKLRGEEKEKWAKLLKELTDLTGEKITITDLVKRSADAYYTPDVIIGKMANLTEFFAKEAGEDLAKLIKLEPSAGIGRFLNAFELSNFYAVEKDALSANIAKALYEKGGAIINNGAYEKSPLKINNTFDLVIGNPPYANFKIGDDEFRENIHNYFMKKNIDVLKPNGLSLQIITHNFLDAQSDYTRKVMAKDAVFLGAVRLANNVFKDASVTTDIIAFRKKAPDEMDKEFNTSWVESVEYEGAYLNKYFLENPQNVIGKMEVVKNQFGGKTIAVKPNGFDIENLNLSNYIKNDKLFKRVEGYIDNKLLSKAVQRIEEKEKGVSFFGSARSGELRFDKESDKFLVLDDQQNTHDFNIYERISEAKPNWQESSINNRVEALKEMMPQIEKLKKALFDLKEAELNPNSSDEKIEILRRILNKAYDELHGKNGSFRNARGKISQKWELYDILDDTSFELFALEKKAIVEERGDKKIVIGSEKSEIFHKRLVKPYEAPTSANNINEALQISKAEYGKIDLVRMSELLSKDMSEVENELLEQKRIYKDHLGGNVEKDEFLSGNVREKIARFYDENGSLNLSSDEKIRAFQMQSLEDLKAIVPDDIELPFINIPLGATWLDKEILREFFAKELEIGEVNFKRAGNRWYLLGKFNGSLEITTSEDYLRDTGIKAINAVDYILKMMNNESLEVKTSKTKADGSIKHYKDPIATQKLQDLKIKLEKQLKNFIMDNEEYAEQTKRVYNDVFNSEVIRKYDGSHIRLMETNEDISLRSHQNNAVYRFLQKSNTLLAHDVGTGKTYTMIASAMLSKQLGLAKKSLIVTPNNVSPQMAREARELFPNARIKLIQGVSTKEKNRLMADVKNNEYDLIIVSYDTFKVMNANPKLYADYLNEELIQLRCTIEALENSDEGDERIMKQLAKRLESEEAKLEHYLEQVANGSQNVFFEDLGIDNLIFDEAHYLKKLPIFTKQGNVRGIQRGKSQRALDAYIKIKHHQSLNKKVMFATGTPITNFVSDIYVMQKFLGRKALEDSNISEFDDWSAMFAGSQTQFELKASGNYEATTRLRNFANLPELKKMYYEFTDVVTKDDVKKQIMESTGEQIEPTPVYEEVIIKQSEAQKAFYEEIKERSVNLKGKKIEKGGDNHLKILSDANKASLDMRLIYPHLERDANGKVMQAAEKIVENYHLWDADKGTQLVFLDKSTPKKSITSAKRAKLENKLSAIKEKLEKYENDDINLSEEALEKLEKEKVEIEEILEMAGEGFSVYEDLRKLLIEKGIKPEEIAFVQDYDKAGTGALSQADLSEKINNGKIRVLIGSTAKMGAGANYQRKLSALHHLDLDWTPANMEQREGRIIRQGNELFKKYGDEFKAKIYYYVTEQTSDTVMLQTLNQKRKIIKQITDINEKARFLEDSSEDDFMARLQAATSPYAEEELRFLGIDKEISLLNSELENSAYVIKSAEREILKQNEAVEGFEAIKSLLPSILKKAENNISFKTKEGKIIDFNAKPKKDEASPHEKLNMSVKKSIESLFNSSEKLMQIGEYRGSKLFALKAGNAKCVIKMGENLQNSLYFTELDYMDIKGAFSANLRFKNAFEKISKNSYFTDLEQKIKDAKEAQKRALKKLENEKPLNLQDFSAAILALNASLSRFVEQERGINEFALELKSVEKGSDIFNFLVSVYSIFSINEYISAINSYFDLWKNLKIIKNQNVEQIQKEKYIDKMMVKDMLNIIKLYENGANAKIINNFNDSQIVINQNTYKLYGENLDCSAKAT